MHVIHSVLGDIPLLLEVVKVSTKLLSTWVSLFECEVLPQVLVEELVNWGIRIDSSSGIAVPVPDTTGSSSLLENLDFESLLAKSEGAGQI